jgi:hypothetical protein
LNFTLGIFFFIFPAQNLQENGIISSLKTKRTIISKFSTIELAPLQECGF